MCRAMKGPLFFLFLFKNWLTYLFVVICYTFSHITFLLPWMHVKNSSQKCTQETNSHFLKLDSLFFIVFFSRPISLVGVPSPPHTLFVLKTFAVGPFTLPHSFTAYYSGTQVLSYELEIEPWMKQKTPDPVELLFSRGKWRGKIKITN